MNAHEAMLKYPTRVAVWISVAADEKNIPDLDRHKYLIERDMTMSQVIYVIRKRVVLDNSTALFILMGDKGILPSSTASVGSMYDALRSDDGS